MIIKYCCLQTVIKLDKVWRHLLSLFSQKGAVGISKSVFWIHQHSISLLQWLQQPVPFRSSWSYTWQNLDSAQPLQSSFSSGNSSTLAHAHPYTPLSHWLIPCCCSQGGKIPFSTHSLPTWTQRKEFGKPHLCCSTQHNQQKAAVTVMWKETAAPVLSLKPATLPTHTPREGQRDAPESAQATTFLSTEGKVRGSFRHTGWPPQGPGAAGAGGSLCALIPMTCAGSTALLKGGCEKCLWRQTRRARAPAHRTERCPSGQSHTATSRGIF